MLFCYYYTENFLWPAISSKGNIVIKMWVSFMFIIELFLCYSLLNISVTTAPKNRSFAVEI